MKTVNRRRWKNVIFLVGSVLVWGLLGGTVQAASIHNSSRSNTGQSVVHKDVPGPVLQKIQAAIDQGRATEPEIRKILNSNGITGMNVIRVEHGAGGVSVIVTRSPADERDARRILGVGIR